MKFKKNLLSHFRKRCLNCRHVLNSLRVTSGVTEIGRSYVAEVSANGQSVEESISKASKVSTPYMGSIL